MIDWEKGLSPVDHILEMLPSAQVWLHDDLVMALKNTSVPGYGTQHYLVNLDRAVCKLDCQVFRNADICWQIASKEVRRLCFDIIW